MNGMFGALFLADCESCGASEERCFTDTWTGKTLCAVCLSAIIEKVTMSPASEGDNLEELLGLLEEVRPYGRSGQT